MSPHSIIHDPALVRLGRNPKREDPRTLKLRDYLSPYTLPEIPPMMNWGSAVPDWGMMQNDILGDCTAAAAGHIILSHTANRDAPIIVSDTDILKVYEATGGYVPGDPSTDNGAVEIDVLNYWRNTGIAGHHILAYASIDTTNAAMVREAIYLFGAIYAGVRLPISAQNQDVWSVTDRTFQGDAAINSWGGHAVPLVGFDDAAYSCVTWGAQKWMTEEWFRVYAEEAYALVSIDWSPPDAVAPNRFNLEQLKADLNLL